MLRSLTLSAMVPVIFLKFSDMSTANVKYLLTLGQYEKWYPLLSRISRHAVHVDPLYLEAIYFKQ